MSNFYIGCIVPLNGLIRQFPIINELCENNHTFCDRARTAFAAGGLYNGKQVDDDDVIFTLHPSPIGSLSFIEINNLEEKIQSVLGNNLFAQSTFILLAYHKNKFANHIVNVEIPIDSTNIDYLLPHTDQVNLLIERLSKIDDKTDGLQFETVSNLLRDAINRETIHGRLQAADLNYLADKVMTVCNDNYCLHNETNKTCYVYVSGVATLRSSLGNRHFESIEFIVNAARDQAKPLPLKLHGGTITVEVYQ